MCRFTVIAAMMQSHKYSRIYTPLLMWDTLFQRIYFTACGQSCWVVHPFGQSHCTFSN